MRYKPLPRLPEDVVRDGMSDKPLQVQLIYIHALGELGVRDFFI
jgi:hypothetical protein